MNETLVANRNRIVDPGDEVLFLGDLTMEGDFAAFQRWLERLNGHIHFVVGDHDVSVMDVAAVDRYEYLQFQHRGIPIYAVHDPEDAPRNWKG